MTKKITELFMTKSILLVSSFILLSSTASCDQKPAVSACQCLDNINAGWYDNLSQDKQKIRKFCLDKYAGEAGMLLDCMKEREKK